MPNPENVEKTTSFPQIKFFLNLSIPKKSNTIFRTFARLTKTLF